MYNKLTLFLPLCHSVPFFSLFCAVLYTHCKYTFNNTSSWLYLFMLYRATVVFALTLEFYHWMQYIIECQSKRKKSWKKWWCTAHYAEAYGTPTHELPRSSHANTYWVWFARRGVLCECSWNYIGDDNDYMAHGHRRN